MIGQEREKFVVGIKQRLQMAATSPADAKTLQGIFHTPDHNKIAELLIERQLEEVNFSFCTEPLTNLTGFMISKDGYYEIIFAAGLVTSQRIALIFHSLGHAAQGHTESYTDSHTPNVVYEYRNTSGLPRDYHLKNLLANSWAKQTYAQLLRDQISLNPVMGQTLRLSAQKIKRPSISNYLLLLTHNLLHPRLFRLPG